MVDNDAPVCINCSRNDMVIPLIKLQFKGDGFWLCSACLPTLLHQPGRLVGRLPGAEEIQPISHDHH